MNYILVHRRDGLENVEKMYIFCVMVNENKHLIPVLYIMSMHTHGISLLKGILTFASDIFPVLVFFSNHSGFLLRVLPHSGGSLKHLSQYFMRFPFKIFSLVLCKSTETCKRILSLRKIDWRWCIV